MFDAGGAPWLDVSALGAERYRLRLGGTFSAGFLGNLCHALSSRQLSIEQAHAVRVRASNFSAELYTHRLSAGVDPRQVPWLQLASLSVCNPASVPMNPTLASLRRVQVRVSAAHGGSLYTSISGPDSLGLLGHLLGLLDRLGLDPVEMHVETHAGVIEDSFWLVSRQPAAALGEMRAQLLASLQEG